MKPEKSGSCSFIDHVNGDILTTFKIAASKYQVKRKCHDQWKGFHAIFLQKVFSMLFLEPMHVREQICCNIFSPLLYQLCAIPSICDTSGSSFL